MFSPATPEVRHEYDVLVIGGGQSGLAVGYYLRRSGLAHAILDAQEGPGGAWRQAWESLTLFSPARWSSLPGWLMPGGEDEYPGRDAVVEYLAGYERRYNLPVLRPLRVSAVRHDGERLLVESDGGAWRARAVVSATGSFEQQYIPDYPGRELFQGRQIHSAQYRSPKQFAGQRVLIVGGGNSGAQILAEVSRVAGATWVTLEPPTYMPDNVDGRAIFELASRRYLAKQRGEEDSLREVVSGGLGDIVMVPPVKEARRRGALQSVRPFARFTPEGVVWPDGHETAVDAVIWCTGFRPALEHLRPLGVIEPDGQVLTAGTRAVKEPRLWLVGYGEWTGYASATLVGVARSARGTVEEIVSALG